MTFYFIESSKERYEHLQAVLESRYKSLPVNININTINGVFDKEIPSVLQAIEQQNKRAAPCFAMIDPFGVSHTPMSVMKLLLNNPKTELYISLMYQFINRFKKSSEFEPHLNELYGCNDWKAGRDISEPSKRRDLLYNIYKQQLKVFGANQVVTFDLYRGNVLVYSIFFATKHLKGSDKMKQAIWKIAPDGELKFRGTHSEELILDVNANFELLQRMIINKFRDKETVSIEAIQQFVASDDCDFHTGHTKTKALKEIEKSGKLTVVNDRRKRKNTYPDGTIIRFIYR